MSDGYFFELAKFDLVIFGGEKLLAHLLLVGERNNGARNNFKIGRFQNC